MGLSDSDLNEVLRACAETAVLDSKKKVVLAKAGIKTHPSCSPVAEALRRSSSSVDSRTGSFFCVTGNIQEEQERGGGTGVRSGGEKSTRHQCKSACGPQRLAQSQGEGSRSS